MSQTESDPDNPYGPPEAAPLSPREKPMGFWQHIEELRGTIVKSVITFIVFATLVGIFFKEFNHWLQWPLQYAMKEFPDMPPFKLGVTSPLEVFTMLIQMCVMGGLMLSLPFILFFVGQFVSPALTEREMKAVLPMCVSAMILFLVGAAFGFFLLMPATMVFSIKLTQEFDLTFYWTVGRYYGQLMWLVLGVGAAFEFPLLLILLVWMGILSTDFLRKYRRHAIVVIFVIAAIVTPTPDPFVQTIFAVPLYILFEVAIVVCARIERRKRQENLLG